jgi:hypothetical protein
MKTYKVTLEFTFALNGVDAPDELARHIHERLNSHSDGRHQFSAELIHHGLERLVTASVETAVEDQHRKEHGNAMVSTKTGKIVKSFRRASSCTSLAGLLTSKIMRNVSVYMRGSAACPRVEEID